MKIAPLVRAVQSREGIAYRIVHTGQHYDHSMSDVFFEELGIPEPNHHLGCGGGSHAEQTARIMMAYEKLCKEERPDMVVVVGDVNSTLACSVVAVKTHIPVAHVEAGLRSGDRTMPEEINRIVTDAISDIFFVTEPSGVEHLIREGKPEDTIHYVGHVMVDNLIYQKRILDEYPLINGISVDYKNKHAEYGVVTMHRPSNVDNISTLGSLASALRRISEILPLAFPAHPRTRANLVDNGIDLGRNITLLEPMPYMDFLNLWKDARMVLTDSGGLQEETTALGIPCITLRENTERPITIDEGTNILAGTDPEEIYNKTLQVINGNNRKGKRPKYWDGAAAERIVTIISDCILGRKTYSEKSASQKRK